MVENYHISVDSKKAKEFVAFLKTLDFVEVEKEIKKVIKRAEKSTPLTDQDFPYFGMGPDWDVDAKELRAQSNNRSKASW